MRITDFGRAMNPVWGPEEIVFDRFRRRKGDAPAFNLWALDPADDGALRRLTQLKIPPLVSGLVPLEFSADARRLLAVFTGQDTAGRLHRGDAHRQDPRALDRTSSSGIVGFDLSRDGRRILAHSGGWDPRRGARRDQRALRRRRAEGARRGRRLPGLDALATSSAQTQLRAPAPPAQSRAASRSCSALDAW